MASDVPFEIDFVYKFLVAECNIRITCFLVTLGDEFQISMVCHSFDVSRANAYARE